MPGVGKRHGVRAAAGVEGGGFFVKLHESCCDARTAADLLRLPGVRELADEGAAVLVVSSDLPELLELSDVIHVVRDGRIQGTLPRAEADEKTVMSLASGETMVSA